MIFKFQLISKLFLNEFIHSLSKLFLLLRIIGLKEIDLAKSRKETSLNNLETAIIEIRDKLDQPDYTDAATETEIKSILDKCSEVTYICLNNIT